MEITGLDITKGLKEYNDEKVYFKILRSYANSVRSMLDSIETVTKTGLSEDNLEIYKIKVHGIKGASFDISAGLIGAAAKNLEEAAQTGDFIYINENNPGFLENGWKLVCDIEDLIISIDANNPKQKKDKLDREVLEKLLLACENYHLEMIDSAMEEIEKYQYESDCELADWIKENVEKMNFKKIVEKISSLGDTNG